MADKFYNGLKVVERSVDPPTPVGGEQIIYAKTDGKIYRKNSSGIVTELSNIANVIASGNNGDIQFNNATSFSGATNVQINYGNLKLNTISDPTPPPSGLILYASSYASRILPKIIGPAGIDIALQGAMHGSSIFHISQSNGTAVPITIGGTLTTTGTLSSQWAASSTNKWTATMRKRFTTAAIAGSTAGMRTAYTQWFRGNATGYGGFFFRCQHGNGANNLNGGQRFIGLCSDITVINRDPSAFLNMCGMGYDAADVSTGSWFFMFNDNVASTTATKINLGAGAIRDTSSAWDLIMFMKPNSGELFVKITNLITDVVVLDTSYTTNIPDINIGMAFKAEIRNGITITADSFEISKVYIESDY